MSRQRRMTSSRRRTLATPAALMVGQYQGWDQSAAITTWESTNTISIPLGHEFGDNTQWTYFENGTNFANWETWVNAKAGRRFSYSAPLLTANDDAGLTKAQKYAALAAGTYDVHFTNLGNAFQARPALRNSIVRLGWEFNGTTFPWAVPPNDQATLDNYKTGFNRAAAALKAACPTLQIEWCPNCQLDSTNRTFADMYPGDTYIDYIGIGLYDYYWPGGSPTQAQREAWLRDNVNGLADQVALATARGKRLAHTEWGLWTAGNTGGGGDRPEFIDFIADWYAANNYAYSVYNNVSATAEHRLDTYPLSKARYLARFKNGTVVSSVPSVNAGADSSAVSGTAFTRTATEIAGGSPITSRAWTILSGPAGVGTTIGSAAALSWTPTTVGSYVLRYSATNSVGTGTDDVAVTVAAAGVAAPTLIAYVESATVNNTTPKTLPVTVAVGDFLVLTGVTSDSTASLSTPTGGTGFTWTLQQDVNVASHARVQTWTATATSAQTVTFSVARPSTTKPFVAYLKQWRGSSGIGATAKGNSTASGAASLAITTLAANSVLDVTVADWSNTATAPTWRTGAGAFTQQSFDPVGDAAGNYTAATGYHANVGAVGAKTVGITAPNYDWSITAVEVKGT